MPTASEGPARIHVLRIFHAGRNPSHRARDRALLQAGVDVSYVVPRTWPGPGHEAALSAEPFQIVEVDVRLPGEVNRHFYRDVESLARLAVELRVDLVDLFEEPFSHAAGQLLPELPPELPVVMYSAQNLDKRWPPPYRGYERRSLSRVHAFYPCSRQAAAVLRGKGFGGLLSPLPLGYDAAVFTPGQQSGADAQLRLALVGRMVAEKGVSDAIRVVVDLHLRRGMNVELVLAGSGPALPTALSLAENLGVADRVFHRPWMTASELALLYQETHIVLAPSRSTPRWVEQFGRMIVEAQASGCVVVGYDSGSIPEVGGDAAVLVREGDVPSLAEAVSLVLADPGEFETRRGRGLALARERTWSRVAGQQAELYRRALIGHRKPLLGGSPRSLRRRAAEEFGPPAAALGQTRPFALPGLRHPSPVSRTLGHALDTIGEARARIKPAG